MSCIDGHEIKIQNWFGPLKVYFSRTLKGSLLGVQRVYSGLEEMNEIRIGTPKFHTFNVPFVEDNCYPLKRLATYLLKIFFGVVVLLLYCVLEKVFEPTEGSFDEFAMIEGQ